MAYNKAKEEKKWRLWKEAEEKQLRKLGVDESTIETLRTHDWAIFNSDRGTISVCRKRVHTLRELLMIRSSPK